MAASVAPVTKHNTCRGIRFSKEFYFTSADGTDPMNINSKKSYDKRLEVSILVKLISCYCLSSTLHPWLITNCMQGFGFSEDQAISSKGIKVKGGDILSAVLVVELTHTVFSCMTNAALCAF